MICECGREIPEGMARPVFCACGAVHGVPQPPRQTEGRRKAAICRTGQCGHYDARSDACGILLGRGKQGAISYLLRHDRTRCVAEDPLF